MFTLMPYRPYLNKPTNRGLGLLNDNFLRSFFQGDELFASNSFRVDIREKEGTYVLEAELPGVSEDQISLNINNDVLTVAANVASEHKSEKQGYTYCERRTGRLERSFGLDGIAQDQISATYENGILTVLLPKAQPEPKLTTRSIPIGKPALQAGEAEQSNG